MNGVERFLRIDQRIARYWDCRVTRWYGTRKGRDMLTRALENADLCCVTEEDFVKTGKLQKRHTVDHLCVDVSLAERVESIGAWERERADGLRLSDHSGIFVDLKL